MRSYNHTTGNAIVDFIGDIRLEGNIVPNIWYQTVVKDNGKPYAIAILVLADIVYWYRPSEIREEGTGRTIGIKKKFKDDLLQRSYQQLADQFGITKRDATNVIVFLEKLGVIKRHFRNAVIGGVAINNILYLELIPNKLHELTIPTVGNKEICDPSHQKRGEGVTENGDTLSPKSGTGVTENGETNTKITTKITTEITTENLKDKKNIKKDHSANAESDSKSENDESSANSVPKGAYEEIIKYLNDKTAARWKHTGEETKKLIRSRFKEGFTVEDFKTVIDVKFDHWIDSTMKKYLRPSTLFGKKFEGYLNEHKDVMVLTSGQRVSLVDKPVDDDDLPF